MNGHQNPTNSKLLKSLRYLDAWAGTQSVHAPLELSGYVCRLFQSDTRNCARAFFSQGTRSAVLKLKPSACPQGMLGQNQHESWFLTFWSSLVCICQACWLEKSDLTSNSKIQYTLPVVLVRTGYINLTATLETQISWVTRWKSVQMSLPSSACGLAPITTLQLDMWDGGEVAFQPVQPSLSLLASPNPLSTRIQKKLSLLPVCEFSSQGLKL